MTDLYRTANMQPTLFREISLMRNLWAVKCSEVSQNAVMPDVRNPLVDDTILHLGYTKEAGTIPFVAFPDVLEVGLPCGVPKVVNPVIQSITVDVIDDAGRKNSVHIEPCDPMHAVLLVVKPCSQVTGRRVDSTNNWFGVRNLSFSCENASFWVVIKKFAHSVCGNINLSHAVVPVKQWFGQKPRSVSALAGLRHFNSYGVQA